MPGERSAHVTVFSGALGYESSRMDRLAELGMAPAEVPAADSLSERARETLRRRPTSLDELKGHDSDLISDDEMAWLDTLSLDTWDSADFFLYPVLVLFARSSGPNPDWTKHCKSEKMLAGTTHDGWMDEASKLLWYEFTRAYPYSPFGNTGRRIIDQRDQHFSNETVKQSLMQEQDNNVGVGTPGHHTAALQHMDQRGGPIQHANAFLRPLVRREQRSKGTIDESGMMRIIEIAVAASHTPKIFSYASRRVGWGEDASGKLCYDPMKTCDSSCSTPCHYNGARCRILDRSAASRADNPSRQRLGNTHRLGQVPPPLPPPCPQPHHTRRRCIHTHTHTHTHARYWQWCTEHRERPGGYETQGGRDGYQRRREELTRHESAPVGEGNGLAQVGPRVSRQGGGEGKNRWACSPQGASMLGGCMRFGSGLLASLRAMKCVLSLFHTHE